MKIIRACFLLTAAVAILNSTAGSQSTSAAADSRLAPPASAASAPFPGTTGGEDGDDTGWG